MATTRIWQMAEHAVMKLEQQRWVLVAAAFHKQEEIVEIYYSQWESRSLLYVLIHVWSARPHEALSYTGEVGDIYIQRAERSLTVAVDRARG